MKYKVIAIPQNASQIVLLNNSEFNVCEEYVENVKNGEIEIDLPNFYPQQSGYLVIQEDT